MSTAVEGAPLPNITYPYDLPTIDQPVGIVIAGESQTGKSTLKEYIADALGALDQSGGRPPAFPLSNGFRGVTAAALAWWRTKYGLESSAFPQTPTACTEMASAYADWIKDSDTLWADFDRYYEAPESEGVLRNEAVNATVPYMSENEFIHPLVIAAAGRHLNAVMHKPKTGRPPLAVVLDGRNKGELASILREGDVALAGLFVLTCRERDSVKRNKPDARFWETVRAARVLRARNDADLHRPDPVGPTTLPRNVPGIVTLHEHMPVKDIQRERIPRDRVATMLFNLGFKVSGSTEKGIHIATDTRFRVGLDVMRTVASPLTHGMVGGLQAA